MHSCSTVLCNVYFFSLTYRFSDYYSVCAIGGQHDGHLSFWLPSFVKLIVLLLHVLFAVAETNILLLLITTIIIIISTVLVQFLMPTQQNRITECQRG